MENENNPSKILRGIKITLLFLSALILLTWFGGGFGFNELADAGIDNHILRLHGSKILLVLGIIFFCIAYLMPPKELRDKDLKTIVIGIIVTAILSWIAC